MALRTGEPALEKNYGRLRIDRRSAFITPVLQTPGSMQVWINFDDKPLSSPNWKSLIFLSLTFTSAAIMARSTRRTTRLWFIRVFWG